MRISDWSSDVCSSDLGEAADLRRAGARRARRVEPVDVEAEMNRAVAELRPDLLHQRRQRLVPAFLGLHDAEALGARPARKRVVSGTRVSVRVASGGPHTMKTKTHVELTRDKRA